MQRCHQLTVDQWQGRMGSAHQCMPSLNNHRQLKLGVALQKNSPVQNVGAWQECGAISIWRTCDPLETSESMLNCVGGLRSSVQLIVPWMQMKYDRQSYQASWKMGLSLLPLSWRRVKQLTRTTDTLASRSSKSGVLKEICQQNNLALLRAEIVRWVSESLHLFSIIDNRGFQSLMKTGHPAYYIPSCWTVSCDVHLVFVHTCNCIAEMLQVSSDMNHYESG